jgi:hypothetical protein
MKTLDEQIACAWRFLDWYKTPPTNNIPYIFSSEDIKCLGAIIDTLEAVKNCGYHVEKVECNVTLQPDPEPWRTDR